jgi:hypothetical protein
MDLEVVRIGGSPVSPPNSFSSSVFASLSIASPFFLPHTTLGFQSTLDSLNEKKRKEVDLVVRRFLYHNLSFNIAKSSFY